MPEAIIEGHGDELVGREESKSDEKSKEEKKTKEKGEKKADEKKKEKIRDFKGKRVSLKNIFNIAVAKLEAHAIAEARKRGQREPFFLNEGQINILKQSLIEAGIEPGEIARMMPKTLLFNAFNLIDQGEPVKDRANMTDKEAAEAMNAYEKAKKISTRELEVIDVMYPIAGASDGEEGEEIKDSSEADKAVLLAELPDETTAAEPLKYYIRELKDLIGKEWKGAGELMFDEAKRLSEQFSDDLRKGELSRDDDGAQAVRRTLDTVSGELHKQTRKDIARLRPTEKEAFPLKNKLASDIQRMMKLDEGSEDWRQLQRGLQAEINKAKDETNNDYSHVYEVVTAVRGANSLCSEEGTERYEKFKRIIPEDDLKVILSDGEDSILEKRNRKFMADWRNMSDAARSSLAGDIDESADLYVQAILSGWRTMGNAENDLREFMDAKEDPRGFRKWRATEALRGLETTILENQKTRVPANPADIEERITNVFRKAEAAGLSTEDLGPILNEGLLLVRAMPSSTALERKRREKLLHRLESFRAIHVMLINLEKGDMDPQKVLQTFSELWEGREEVTLEDFLSRYEEDDRGREFYMGKDEEGKDKKANLFDEEFRLYSERLRDERIRMNMIEEMTKYSITAPNMAEIKKNVGFDRLSDDWKAKWDGEFAKLRQYFIDKMNEKGIPLDDWGKAKETGTIKPLIEEWHKKRTLHGAMGTVDSDKEAIELAVEFGEIKDLDKLSGDERTKAVDKAKRDYKGRQYLDIRRSKLVEDFKQDLKDRGLNVNRNFSWKEGEVVPEKANIDELSEKGYFESLDNTAYRMAWVMMWSNYDNIRIYSKDRKTNLHDDYEGIVFHSSTNIFAARGIDHLWEFFHTDNENRGRAKHNEVNVNWKQFLPGKHHYLFPQNTMLVRWSSQFMTKEQNDEVERRIHEYQDKYDFHNPGREGREGYDDEYYQWMRSAVVMDMVENGEFFLGQRGFGMTDLAKRKKLKKFEFIDVFTDRSKVNAYISTGELQAYLANPTSQKFIELNRKDKFYSTRSARQFPWMTLATRAHWEIANKHFKRLFDKENLQSVHMEQIINSLVANGDMEKEAGAEFKRKNLGFIKVSPRGDPQKLPAIRPAEQVESVLLGGTFARRVRQALELVRESSWENRFAPLVLIGAFFAGLFGDIGKRFFRQTTGTDK